MKISVFVSLLWLSIGCGLSQQNINKNITSLNFDQFEPYLHQQSDTLYLINFWATWCAPCVEELPAMEQVQEKYGKNKFKVILVSLDFPNQLESRVKPFVRQHKLKSEIILLNDPNQNRWIDKVDPAWSGEIPFTVIYKQNTREFFSHSFTFHQLDSIINFKINQP